MSKISISPLIDGNINSVWHYADSITNFTQWYPNEGESPTESTKVYMCCDDKNIYIAFKCFDTTPSKLEIRIVPRDQWDGDHVWVILDTFGDKTTAYEFCVNAAGVQLDAKLSQDGRLFDPSWDGVWYSATKITDYGHNVEIKIPFKTLRFKPGLTEWGVNFFRNISRKHEDVSWIPIKQSEGIRVSRCGILKEIHPGKQGPHLEVYPVALARHETDSIYPQIGLDIGWGLTPSSQFSLTTYPDFAQIEADPYTINLSKHEIYFEERRPFFVEGKEVFDTPIKLFYSRRIGKRIYVGNEVKEIPIIAGAKYTGSINRVNFGFLETYTDKVSTESKNLYSVGRMRFGMLENSDLGILYSEVRDNDSRQGAGGIDFTFRTSELQLQSQIATTVMRKEKNRYAKLAKLDWYAPRFMLISGYESYDENFDIERIGFIPWRGFTKYYLSGGPQFFNVGPFYSFNVGIGSGREKESSEPNWGYWTEGWISPIFKNNSGCSFYLSLGKSYEIDRWYQYKQTTLDFWSDNKKPLVISNTFWYRNYSYNYRRGYFASMGTNNLCLGWRMIPSLTLSINLSNTMEWKPNGELEEVSWVLRPTLQYALTKDIHLKIYAEPNTDTHIHQLNALLSYNFMPKSWFYLALNETRDNIQGKMSPEERIIVIKLRYLFFL